LISVVEFQERRKKLALSLNDNSIAIVSNGPERFRKGDTGYPFTPNPNFYYLTGFTEADAVAVIIKLASKLTYHLFSQKIEPLKTIWTGERIGQERACSEFLVDKSDPLEAFSDFLKNFAAHNQNVSWYCDFNDEFIKSKLTNQLNLNAENLSPLIAEMRLVKSKAEIAVMQSAADISSRAHRKLMGLCRPGLYEYELGHLF